MWMFMKELAADSKILPVGRERRFKFRLVPFSHLDPSAFSLSLSLELTSLLDGRVLLPIDFFRRAQTDPSSDAYESG